MPQRLINNRFWRGSAYLRSLPWFGYVFAAVSFLIALTLRFMTDDYLPSGFPFLTFFPAVILTAFLGGTRAGVLCAVASTLAAHYYFIAPINSFHLNFQSSVAVGFFMTVMFIDLWIIDILNRAVEGLQKEKIYTQKLLDQQTTLFQELQHRVANNLGFVSNLLNIQKGRVDNNPVALGALDDARVRLETMSRVHRRLYDPSNADMPLEQYLQELCADMVEATGVKNVTCVVQAPVVRFDLEKTLNLSLIIIEAVTNSLKHAFVQDEDGLITIAITPFGVSNYVLTIQDNGRGFPDGFDPAKSDRLGFSILLGFARSLGGDISYGNHGGSQVKLVFPA